MPTEGLLKEEGEQQQESEESSEGSEASELVVVDVPLEQLGLELGQTIEVRWQLTPTEGGEPYCKWWRGTIHAWDKEAAQTSSAAQDTTGAQQDPAAEAAGEGVSEQDTEQFQHIFTLRYEPDEGFEAESCNVVFVSDRWMFDLGCNSEIAYRKLGDAWEPEEEVTAQRCADLDLPVEGKYVVFKPMSDAERARNRAKLDKEAASSMQGLEPAQQRALASCMVDMQDAIKEMIERKESEGGAVIDKEDVQEMVRRMKEKRARFF